MNFKLRHYADTCECCEHDCCNIRWSNIRHEFDKYALKEEDRHVSIAQCQDVLDGLYEDIEERRGGLPLTSKQKVRGEGRGEMGEGRGGRRGGESTAILTSCQRAGGRLEGGHDGHAGEAYKEGRG